MVAEESFQNMVWAMLHGLAHSLQLMEISLSLISIFPASRFLTSRKMFLGNEVVDLCQAQLELRPPPRHQHLLQPDLHGGTNALSVIAPELAIKRPESHAMPWRLTNQTYAWDLGPLETWFSGLPIFTKQKLCFLLGGARLWNDMTNKKIDVLWGSYWFNLQSGGFDH